MEKMKTFLAKIKNTKEFKNIVLQQKIGKIALVNKNGL
jgi:hypothetical protein